MLDFPPLEVNEPPSREASRRGGAIQNYKHACHEIFFD
jgi:hypothetical protein